MTSQLEADRVSERTLNMDSAPPASPLLEIRNLRKSYGDKAVLKGIDLAVPVGSVVALIGASGSGKSTLLRCINYLETPEPGSEIWLGGEMIGQIMREGVAIPLGARELRRQRASIGMVFQHFNLFPNLTALDNITEAPIAHRRLRKAEARELAQSLLERVGLADKGSAYPSQLSGGQQQRVAIARALAMQPRLILFDEVTSALDPELVEEVLGVMLQLARDGMTMVVVTHEMTFAEDVADEVVFMDGGMIVEQGAPTAVMRAPQHPRTQSFLQRMLRRGLR
jgi:polar amino acid transport system ATP-binding protein